MGLAGRKQKQRIPADPRNLSWADDASRFGLSYLSKLGWDASQGLGSSGDGMKTHLKVEQKLDMMGIGAQHQRDPNGIAWKQNKEFEALLKRLNQNAEQGDGMDGVDAQGTALGTAFVRAQKGQSENKSSAVTKKRKRNDEDDTDAIENMKGDSTDKAAAQCTLDSTFESPPPRAPSPPPASVAKSRPMAHRARIRAAKRITDKSASAISEILGIAPSSVTSSSTSTPTPTPTTPSASDPQTPLSLDKLTTSTKSVADYFKEKLLARSSASTSPIISSVPSGSATPGLGTTGLGSELSSVSPPDDEVDLPRRGIGSRTPAILPLLQAPERSTSDGNDSNTDARDMLTEKQRRKLEREKRKRRKTEDDQVSTSSKEHRRNDAKTVRKTSKEKKRRERKQRMPTGGPCGDDDIIAEIEPEGDISRGSSQKPHSKSKREHKKKRSEH